LWPDNDQAGIEAMRKLSKLVDSSRISFINTTSLPPKYDLADPIELETIKKLYRDREQINMNIFPDQVSFKEILGMITKKQEAKFFGFSNMDKHLSLPNAGIVTVEGRSGHGKSVFMLNLALRLLRKTNYNVVFISYEVPKQEAFLRFLMAAEGRELSPVTYQNMEAYKELILSSGSTVIADEINNYYNNRFWISDYSSSLKELLGWLDTTKMENTVIFIDYLQIIPNKGYGNSNSARYQVIKDTIEALREMALRRSQVIVVGSQVTDGEIPAQDQARESKDVLFTSALTLQVWNKDMARVSETVKTKKGGKGEDDVKEDYFNNVAGNYAVSVKKSRVGGLGKVFGFNLLFGCLLQEAEVGYTEF
jgi:archaellum biogenesis ATPase FlaH